MNRVTSVDFTIAELEALSKTVGIALDNIASKVDKFPASTDMGRVARQDRALLGSVRSIVSDALMDAYNDESDVR